MWKWFSLTLALTLITCGDKPICDKFKVGEVVNSVVSGKVQITNVQWIGQCYYDARLENGKVYRFQDFELHR